LGVITSRWGAYTLAVIHLVSWNIAHKRALWAWLHDLDADVALLQEAGRPGPEWALAMGEDPADRWETALVGGRGRWRTAVVRLTDRVELHPRAALTLDTATSADDWVVSRFGSIAAADVVIDGAVAFTAVSVYAAWERTASGTLYADGSAHRVLSDLSALMPRPNHRLVIAGDWNVLRGYGEHGDPYWRARYDTVFERAEALGLTFVGPQAPNGQQANPWPDELPTDSLCVPTFHHSRQKPATATRQLDFVFASTSLADRIEVRALNTPEEWGPSDHCRVAIDIAP
jgi:exonuclease III